MIRYIAQAGPWLVALAPAWFVYDSLVLLYHVPALIAGPVAAGVELTGVAAFHTALRAVAWNREKLKSDPAAPQGVALSLVAVYLVAGIALTAVVKGDWTLGLFFALAGAGYAVIAVADDQQRREQATAEASAERSRKRQASAGRPPERPRTAAPTVQRSPDADREVKRLANAANGSEFGRADAEEWLGVGKTKASQVVKYGLDTEQIEHIGGYRYICRNGHPERIDAS